MLGGYAEDGVFGSVGNLFSRSGSSSVFDWSTGEPDLELTSLTASKMMCEDLTNTRGSTGLRASEDTACLKAEGSRE